MLGFETGALTFYFEEGDFDGPVFEYAVDDVQAAKARLVAAGCAVVEENEAIPRCYLRDRFGLVFNLTKA
jgi:predicted enzyme related to lactoylglutathione lyase